MSRSRASTEAGRRHASKATGRTRSTKHRAAARASAEVPAPKRTASKSERGRATSRRSAPKARSSKPRPKRASTRSRPKRASTRSRPKRRLSLFRPRTGRKRPLRRPRPLHALWAIGGGSWRYRLAVVAILAATAGAAYMFWLRDSSLVAVDNVDVVGVTSGDRAQIVGGLTRVAEDMTTLHVDTARLEQAARAFPTVAAISIDPNFPHGMRIEVTERPPALVVSADGEQVAAAADGTLLRGVEVSDDDHLPVLELGKVPGGGALDGDPLDQALVLGAAPEPLRPLIEKIDADDKYGIEVTLRGGIPLRFGSSSAAADKWAAAAAVLADPKLDGLTYVDVRVPERAAAGGASPAPGTAEPPA